MPIEQLAAECGFGSAASLRLRFRERTGTSPTAYRRTFAAA
jgi:transcriptional regulator GlxA family with amidase domain